MITINNKKECCGCMACASVCKHHCIKIVEDAEGFTFPKVDTSNCLECGLCEKVCPMLHPESINGVLKVFGAKNKNEVIRKASSSGGVFSLIAEAFITEGGAVVGCAMDDSLQAVHVVCTSKDELARLRSSKYVQSNLEGVFQKVRKLLKEGRIVLFSGTPCQIAALRNFLLKPYDNLYCIDVLCHGVPSPKLFREYKEMMELKYQSKAIFVSYRCKKREWKRLYINMKFRNGKEYFKSATFDPYMQLFLNNLSQRNACFHCPYTTLNRQGDISLGDFWGIGRYAPDLDDDKGISLILINSENGMKVFNRIKQNLSYFESDIEHAVSGNKVLIENIKGEDNRDKFYAEFVENGLSYAFNNNTKDYSFFQQRFINVTRYGLDIVRKLLKKGY